MINKIKQLLNNKRVQYGLYAIAIIVGILSYILIEQSTNIGDFPVPNIIVSPTPIEQFLPSPTTVFTQPRANPNQTINFSPVTQVPPSQQIKTYQINKLLISRDNIQNMAFRLGFKTSDIYDTNKEGTYLWKTETSNFSGSISLGQISYESFEEPSSDGPINNKETAIAAARKFLSELLGPEFANSIQDEPKINYMKSFSNISINKYGRTTADQATIFEMVFHQSIEKAPLVSVSSSSDNIIVAIDRQGNLDHMTITGGYLAITEKESLPSINPSDISKMLTAEGRRITPVTNISVEKALSEANNVNFNIKTIKLGYLQELSLLTPVYIVDGVLSATNVPAQNTTYIIRATQ